MKVQYDPCSSRDRVEGALLGAAIGDAVGVTYEFRKPAEIPAGHFQIVGGGPFDFKPGEGSDDTALLEISLAAYEARGEFRPSLALRGMTRWLASSPPDVGIQTRKAITTMAAGNFLAPDEQAQGNGGLMRAAAHGLACDDPDRAAFCASIDTRLTHPSTCAADCSAYYASVLRRVIDRDRTLDLRAAPTWLPYPEPITDQGGHCLHSLRLALWALLYADSYEHGIDAVIRTGGDTDTNATIAGAYLGARFGAQQLPSNWRHALDEEMVQKLMGHAERLSFW